MPVEDAQKRVAQCARNNLSPDQTNPTPASHPNGGRAAETNPGIGRPRKPRSRESQTERTALRFRSRRPCSSRCRSGSHPESPWKFRAESRSGTRTASSRVRARSRRASCRARAGRRCGRGSSSRRNRRLQNRASSAENARAAACRSRIDAPAARCIPVAAPVRPDRSVDHRHSALSFRRIPRPRLKFARSRTRPCDRARRESAQSAHPVRPE